MQADLARAELLFGSFDYKEKTHRLFKMNLEKREPVEIARGWDASWSHDGRRIAFVFGQEANNRLYVMDADGTDRRRLTTQTRVGSDGIAWSPDDKRLVFTVACYDRNLRRQLVMQLAVIGADGTNEKEITHDAIWYWYPQWLSEGEILISKNWEKVLTVDADTGRHIKEWPFDGAYGTLSPSRAYLAFTRDSDLYVFDTRSNATVNVTNSIAQESCPVWVGDNWIVFAAKQPQGRNDVFIMRPDGRDVQRLTETEAEEKPTSVHLSAP
jgi:Tol biopolymer transport system component